MEEQYYSMPQQLPVHPNDIYAQQLNEDKIKNILSQISPANQLEAIEWRIRNYKKNMFTGQWERINGKNHKPVNEELISRYISWLGTFMDLNVTMGNLSETQITKIMHSAVEWVTDDIDTNAELYTIGGDYTERTRIGDILLLSTFFVLNRSLNGAESRRFWKTLNLNESSNSSQGGNNNSDWWKFWKK